MTGFPLLISVSKVLYKVDPDSDFNKIFFLPFTQTKLFGWFVSKGVFEIMIVVVFALVIILKIFGNLLFACCKKGERKQGYELIDLKSTAMKQLITGGVDLN